MERFEDRPLLEQLAEIANTTLHPTFPDSQVAKEQAAVHEAIGIIKASKGPVNLAEQMLKAFTDGGFKTFGRETFDFQAIVEQDKDDGWTTHHRLQFTFNYEGTKLEKVHVSESRHQLPSTATKDSGNHRRPRR